MYIVYIYIYIHTYRHIYIYVYIYVYIYICIYIYMYIYIYVCIYKVYIETYIYIYIYIYTFLYIYIHIHMYNRHIFIYVYNSIYIYRYINIYIYTYCIILYMFMYLYNVYMSFLWCVSWFLWPRRKQIKWPATCSWSSPVLTPCSEAFWSRRRPPPASPVVFWGDNWRKTRGKLRKGVEQIENTGKNHEKPRVSNVVLVNFVGVADGFPGVLRWSSLGAWFSKCCPWMISLFRGFIVSTSMVGFIQSCRSQIGQNYVFLIYGWTRIH